MFTVTKSTCLGALSAVLLSAEHLDFSCELSAPPSCQHHPKATKRLQSRASPPPPLTQTIACYTRGSFSVLGNYANERGYSPPHTPEFPYVQLLLHLMKQALINPWDVLYL